MTAEIVEVATTYSSNNKAIDQSFENSSSSSSVNNNSPTASESSSISSGAATLMVPGLGEGGVNAWKVVGSPARRASISAISPIESPSSLASEKPSRIRAASISAGGSLDAPPPGLSASIWCSSSPSDDERERFIMRATTNTSPELAILTEEEYKSIPKRCSRSKSSSAIFGPSNAEASEMEDTLPEMSSIWVSKSQRVSVQPSQQTLVWEALRAAQLATTNDMNGNNADELLDRFKEQNDANLRRFTVAPSEVNRFMKRNVLEAPTLEEEEQEENGTVLDKQKSEQHRRRHSIAGPAFDRKLNTKFLRDGFKALGLDDSSKQLEKIDDYFENTASRTRAFQEAGKNLQANIESLSPILRSPETSASHPWPLYVVEFKAGRTDYFYLPAEFSHLKINVGDLAIVEADRGKDLGKVIETGIISMNDLEIYQATHEDPLVDSHNAVGKEIHPKRLFRLAEPSEVAMLLQKGQDEGKANELCQIKIRQKRLPMEIVDAEYQWDRRKLTFYFVADRRIDFRELVRELFKIYKTRIWMCAVQPRSQI